MSADIRDCRYPVNITDLSLETGMHYHGYNAFELAKYYTYDEVLYLLYNSELPTEKQYEDFQNELHSLRIMPEEIKAGLKLFRKDSNCMQLLSFTLNILESLEPESSKNTPYEIGKRIAALFLPVMAMWLHYRKTGKILDSIQTKPRDTIVENFLKLYY